MIWQTRRPRKERKTLPLIWLALAALVLAGCQGLPTIPLFVTPAPARATEAAAPSPAPACDLAPVVAPTPPAQIPGYTQVDPATGLHMTGTPQRIDLATYRLQVTGKVVRPLSLTYDDLRCLPRVEQSCLLICPGYFEDTATWAGASLGHVLELAEVQADATSLHLVSADGFAAIIDLETARAADSFLAYEWEGEPLPILHGFPVRAVLASQLGGKWVKWLVEIRVE